MPANLVAVRKVEATPHSATQELRAVVGRVQDDDAVVQCLRGSIDGNLSTLKVLDVGDEKLEVGIIHRKPAEVQRGRLGREGHLLERNTIDAILLDGLQGLSWKIWVA